MRADELEDEVSAGETWKLSFPNEFRNDLTVKVLDIDGGIAEVRYLDGDHEGRKGFVSASSFDEPA